MHLELKKKKKRNILRIRTRERTGRENLSVECKICLFSILWFARFKGCIYSGLRSSAGTSTDCNVSFEPWMSARHSYLLTRLHGNKIYPIVPRVKRWLFRNLFKWIFRYRGTCYHEYSRGSRWFTVVTRTVESRTESVKFVAARLLFG